MQIKIKRIHEPPGQEDGFRVFVDRLWPIGLKKEAAPIGLWFKIIAPSADLRKWFEKNPQGWIKFKQRYFAELTTKHDLIKELLLSEQHTIITLLYTTGDVTCNNAIALKEYLETL